MLAKEISVYEETFARGFRGLFKNGIYLKGKHVYLVKVVVLTHLYTHKQDLPFPMQVVQVFISYVAHHFLSILVPIFLDACWNQSWWLQWKFNFT